MENLINAWKGMGILGIIIPIAFLLYIIALFIFMKKNKNRQQQWLDAHPDAVKVYLRSEIGLLTSGEIRGSVVSGDAYPGIASEGTKMVFYALPGKLEVEMTYTYTRPGVLYKKVTTTWGPATIPLTLEAGKTYTLSFNKKEENFVLSEEK